MSPRRFLPSLRAPARDVQSKAAVDRRHSAGASYTMTGVPYSPMTDLDLEQAVRKQWERDVWVWRAVDARAKNAAGLDVVVKDARGAKGQPIEGHPLAEVLNGQANPYEPAYFFRWRMQMLLDLSVSKGVFVEVGETRQGVQRVDLLNPMHVWPIPDPDQFVSGFQMRLPSGEVFDQLDPYRRGKGGVIWFRRPHPTDPYQSTSWLRAAGISVDLDYWARRYNLNFLFNDGRPGGVLGIKPAGSEGDEFQGMDPADAEQLQGRLNGGPGNAGKVAIVEADRLDWVDMSQSPRDAQYVEGRQITQREILVAAGTPLSVIGDASGRTFDNADAEFDSFWRTEMKPELRLQANWWDVTTPGGIGDSTQVVDYDWSQVSVLNRDAIALEARLRAEVEAGTRTIDSYLEETGQQAMNLPGTRVLWIPQGKAPVGQDSDVVALLTQGQPPAGPPPPALPPGNGGQPALPPANGPQDGPPELGADGQPIVDAVLVDPLDESQYAAKALRGVPQTLADRRRAEHAALIDRWTAAVADELRGVLARQHAIVGQRLRGAKARRHTRHWDYGTGHPGELKALDPAYVVDRRTWIDQAVDTVVAVVKGAFGAAWENTAKDLGVPASEPGADANEVIARAARLIAEGLDARAGRLQQVIAEREAAGDDIDGIAAAVDRAYGSSDTWADVSSRSVVGAMNAASLMSAVNAGAKAKRWLATDDERTRPTHVKAEGQVRPVAEDFTVGDAELLFPHDPSGPPEEVINCRCTMIYAMGPPDPAATLDADLAALDAAEAGWKDLHGFHGVDVRFIPSQHPRDPHGRFLDVPDVVLPDGSSGRAVSAGSGGVTVQRADGNVVTVPAAQLTTKPAEPAPIHRADLSNPDTPRTRAVTAAESRALSVRGQAKLEALRSKASAPTGLDSRWADIGDEAWTATRSEWGGLTVDAHTGIPLAGDEDLYALSVKPAGLDSVSVPIGADRATFDAAMTRARARFGSELANQQHHLGVFRDEDNGRIDIDPVLVVQSVDDVETIGTYTRAVGGAYRFADGNGYWPPYVAEGAGDGQGLQGPGSVAVAGDRRAEAPAPAALSAADTGTEAQPDVDLPGYLAKYLEGLKGPDKALAHQQMQASFRGPDQTPERWQLARLPDGRYGQVASAPDEHGMVDVVGLPGVPLEAHPLLELVPAGAAPYNTNYDRDAERHVYCSQGHRHWGAGGAAGVLIRNRGKDGTDRYLLQLRAPWVQHGGTWSTPGGAMHLGEDPVAGATREATEELGDLPDGIRAAETFTDEHGGWAYHTVVLDSPTRFATSNADNEGLETGWFTAAEIDAMTLDLHPSFRGSWPTLLDRLEGGKATNPNPHPDDAGGDTVPPTWDDELPEPSAATSAVRAAIAEARAKDTSKDPSPDPVGDMTMALTAMLARAGIPFDGTAEPSALAGEHAAKAGQTGDGAKARQMIPSVEQLVDKGMGAEDAAKEWKRLYNNARFRIRDARLKALKAADAKVAQDQASAPAAPEVTFDDNDVDAAIATIAAQVLGDIEHPAAKPQAIYGIDPEQSIAMHKAGKVRGPGAVPPNGRWQDRAALLEDGDAVPVRNLWIQGHKVEHGTVFKITNAPPILIEHPPGDEAKVNDAGTVVHPAAQRASLVASRWGRVTATVNPQVAAVQRGFAWLVAENPADGHWAEAYGIDGFKSAATGGDGTSTFWAVTPTVGTIAHEFGHNVDRGAPSTQPHRRLVWEGGDNLTSVDELAGDHFEPIPLAPESAGQGAVPSTRSWHMVRVEDQASAATWAGWLKVNNRVFAEARHAPGDHVIMLGDTDPDEGGTGVQKVGGVPTDYGRSSTAEDFAESVRLYLKDHNLGRIGYLIPKPGESAGPVLRFVDLYPERAAYLDTVFGYAPVTDTEWQKAGTEDVVKTLMATSHNSEGWQDDPTAEWPTTAELAASFALPADYVEVAQADAVYRLTQEIEDAKAKVAAEKAAAAAKVAAAKKAAAEAKAKAKAAADAIAAHLADIAAAPPAVKPADPDAVKKIRKRKAWVKWNAKQQKETPVKMAGDSYTNHDLSQLDAKGKLLVKAGGKTLIQWEGLHGVQYRARPVTGTADGTGRTYLTLDTPAQMQMADGKWMDTSLMAVYIAPDPAGDPATETNPAELSAMQPGTLRVVDKVGMSEGDASKVADEYEAQALAELGAGIADASGLPGAPVPHITGLTDKQIGQIVAGAQEVYDDALKPPPGGLPYDLYAALGNTEGTDPTEEIRAALVGHKVDIGGVDGEGGATGTVTDAHYDGPTSYFAIEGTSTDGTPFNLGTENISYVTILDAAGLTPEQAAAVRQDYVVAAVIAALADPTSNADHGAPSVPFTNPARRKASSFNSKGGASVHPKSKTQFGAAEQAKANIAAELGSRLNNETDWETFRTYRASLKGQSSGDKYGGVPFELGPFDSYDEAQRQAYLDQECSNRVGNWASTAGDSNPWSIATQRAVAEEFATGGDWNPHGMSVSQPMAVNYGETNGTTFGEAWDAGVGAFMRRFVRAMWENTQEQFAADGIKEVSLYRGMKIGYSSATVGTWAELGTHEILDLMPANSWSSSRATAEGFSGSSRMLVAGFPVSRILGSARTGFGCLNEHEFVVLNGPGNITVYTSGDPSMPKGN